MNNKIIIYLLFIGFMFIGSFGGIIFYYNTSVNVLQEQTNEYFDAIAHSRAHHIETFLEEQKEKILIISELGLIEESLEFGLFDELDDELDEIIMSNDDFLEIFILNEEGVIMASTSKEFVGDDKSDDLYFISAKEKAYIKDFYYSETIKKKLITISAPIIHDEENKFIGVLVIRIETEKINEIITDRTGLGETGEVYLINKEGYMVSPARFLPEEETFLKQKVDTENAIECLQDLKAGTREKEDEKEDLFIFENYHGEKVIGVDIPIHETQWCLLAEINEREAIGLLRNELIKSGLLILIGISVLIGVFVLVINRFLLEAGK